MNIIKSNLIIILSISIPFLLVSCNIWPYLENYDNYPYPTYRPFSKVFKVKDNISIQDIEDIKNNRIVYQSFSYIKAKNHSDLFQLRPKLTFFKNSIEELNIVNALTFRILNEKLNLQPPQMEVNHVLDNEILEYASSLFILKEPSCGDLINNLDSTENKYFVYPIIVEILDEMDDDLYRRTVGLQIFILNQDGIVYSNSGFVVTEGMHSDKKAHFHQYQNELEDDLLLLANLIFNANNKSNYEKD